MTIHDQLDTILHQTVQLRLEKWDESKINRSKDGRFAEKGQKGEAKDAPSNVVDKLERSLEKLEAEFDAADQRIANAEDPDLQATIESNKFFRNGKKALNRELAKAQKAHPEFAEELKQLGEAYDYFDKHANPMAPFRDAVSGFIKKNAEAELDKNRVAVTPEQRKHKEELQQQLNTAAVVLGTIALFSVSRSQKSQKELVDKVFTAIKGNQQVRNLMLGRPKTAARVVADAVAEAKGLKAMKNLDFLNVAVDTVASSVAVGMATGAGLAAGEMNER